MGLDALQTGALQQAQTAVQQAKSAADKSKTEAQAINKATNAGTAAAKQAVKNAFDAADAAEAAAENAKKLAQQYGAELTDSVKEAKKAADKAATAKETAAAAYGKVEKELDTLTGKLGPAQDLAADTAKRAAAAGVPAGMPEKLTRLIQEEAAATGKRDEAQRAFETAKAEITKAKAAFDTETKAADDTVRCKQNALSKYWYGPTVTDKEKDAQRALEKATADLAAPDEKFQALEKEAARAAGDRQKYQAVIDAKQKLKKEADEVASQATDALRVLNREIQLAQGDLAKAAPKLDVAKSIKEAKDKELAALQKLQQIQQNAVDALQAAGEARQKGLQVCDALNLVAERVDTEIDRGAVFQNLTPAQTLALTEFNQGGSFGENARRLGPTLNNMTEAQFLQKMAAEAPVSTTKLIGPAGAQQPMTKWEYPDGTLVRYKPNGDAFSNGKATYSIEVKLTRTVPDQNQANIAFKVDPQGRAVPKGPPDVKNPYPGGSVKEDAYEQQVMKLGHRSMS